MSRTRTEYHVSGQPSPHELGIEYRRYEFTWLSDEHAQRHGYETAREAALDFRDRVGANWLEVPVVTMRTVTYTDWELVD